MRTTLLGRPGSCISTSGGAWRAVRADDEPPPRADPTGLRSQTFSMQPNSGAPSHPGRPSNPCVSPTRYGRPLMIQKRNYWRTKDQERQARPAPISYQRQRHTGHEGARPKRNRASPSLMARRAGSTYPHDRAPFAGAASHTRHPKYGTSDTRTAPPDQNNAGQERQCDDRDLECMLGSASRP